MGESKRRPSVSLFRRGRADAYCTMMRVEHLYRHVCYPRLRTLSGFHVKETHRLAKAVESHIANIQVAGQASNGYAAFQ